MTEDDQTQDGTLSDTSSPSSLMRLLRKEIYLVIMAVVFMVCGVVYAQIFFPEIGFIRAAIGGMSFGLFCALCAASFRMYTL